ncbi:MAG: hypothetical protein P8H03_08980 [Emcibacteraceae bacterium]|nr:hypothetical protein [Emcibacteraceae bacterium]
MIKIFTFVAVATVIVSTAYVYNLKQGTYDLEERKRDISSQMLKDREAIKVLKAEMAYLSRPERLERLSRRHLVLEATSNEQMVAGVTELTERKDVQMVSLPVDNFQLLLPRQKPGRDKARRMAQVAPAAGQVNAIDLTKMQKTEDKKENPQKAVSLYERILAKIGN